MKSELDPHLFRHEAGRMVAALTRVFGVNRLSLVEDVVQDAFCRALEVWKTRGVPENPSAWLLTTAKNRALDVLRRDRTARHFESEVGEDIESQHALEPLLDAAFANPVIRDEQLRMMFSCCQPRLPADVQIALVLNLLCGFGAPEIAAAFLSSRAAMEKRLSRGKKALANARHLFDLGDAEFEARLGNVQRALYLLFNEGYHGASAEAAVRSELCHEALRLTALLREHPAAAVPSTHALAALMCLQAARLPARVDAAGDLTSLVEQDRSLWNPRALREGLTLFELSASGNELSVYHLEAAIAAVHVSAPSLEQTNWSEVVSLYDRLMSLAPSPVVALNRAIAIGQRDGARRGLLELAAIQGVERLAPYPFYAAAQAEFELSCGDAAAAKSHFEGALALARNPSERRFLEKRLARALLSLG